MGFVINATYWTIRQMKDLVTMEIVMFCKENDMGPM